MDKRVKKRWSRFGRKISAIRTLYIRGRAGGQKRCRNCQRRGGKVLGARAKEIIFTAGGTESDNSGDFGAVYAMTGGIGKLTSLRTDEDGNSTEAELSNSP